VNIKSGSYTVDYYNKNIFPMLAKKKIEDVCNLFPAVFLMFGQHSIMYIKETKTKKIFRITVWLTGNVDIKEVK
jgi:hypothetical protein